MVLQAVAAVGWVAQMSKVTRGSRESANKAHSLSMADMMSKAQQK